MSQLTGVAARISAVVSMESSSELGVTFYTTNQSNNEITNEIKGFSLAYWLALLKNPGLDSQWELRVFGFFCIATLSLI